VIRQDQSVQTVVVQVTVDNQAPEVSVISPVEGQEYASGEILLQADILDNLSIGEVQFYIDDRLISAMAQPPFTLIWEGDPGVHTATIKAIDQAGNSQQVEVNFLVK